MPGFISIVDVSVVTALTPSDTVPLPVPATWLRVGVTGNVALKGVGGASVTVTATAGEYIPIGPGMFVMATGTTATSLVVFG